MLQSDLQNLHDSWISLVEATYKALKIPEILSWMTKQMTK